MPAPPLANTFETGLAEDTAITVANSDDGTAGDAFQSISATAPVYSLTQARGTRSMKIVQGGSHSVRDVAWQDLGALTTDLFVRFYYWCPNRPSGGAPRLLRFYTDAGATSGYLVHRNDNGFLDLFNGAGSGVGAVGDTEPTYSQWVRIEVRIRSATSNGQMEFRLYNDPDSTTISDTNSSSTMVLGANTDEVRFGSTLTGGETNITWYMDELAVSTAGWIGPVATANRVYKRFSGPAQLSGSAATLYTCPTGKRARILHIHASNPSASPVDLNLSIGTDAAATRVYDDYEITADSIEHNYDPYDLAAGDIIQGWASTAGTVVLTITGYEEPA